MASIMKKSKRSEYLKHLPSFDQVLPAALSKDLSQLSMRLGRVEKNMIQVFYLGQQRLRENLDLSSRISMIRWIFINLFLVNLSFLKVGWTC